VEADPANPTILNNYAQFLKQSKKDYELAEEYYLKAIAISPNHSVSLNNYAQFLKEVRRDFEKVKISNELLNIDIFTGGNLLSKDHGIKSR
jgi:Tfp pilus assembly protein PilF